MSTKAVNPLYAAVLACLIALLCGCSGEPKLSWTPDMIVGMTLETMDPPGKASYTFTPDGYVSVDAESADGAMTAPVFGWRIVGGRLVIDDLIHTSWELTLVSRSPTQLVAKRSDGTTERFRVHSYR